MVDIFRLVSWNLREFRSPKDGYVTEVVVRQLKSSRCDVVALQGIGQGVAKRLCELLGPDWTFTEDFTMSTARTQKDCLSVLYKSSRFVMTASNYIEVDAKKSLAVEFLCASNCVKFWVINVALPLPSKTGLHEKREFVRKIPIAVNDFTHNADNILLAGGFNLPFTLGNFAPFREEMFINAIPIHMSTMQEACQNYDNIWYKDHRGLTLNQADVIRVDDSPFDHCPLMLEMYARFLATTNHNEIIASMHQLQASKENPPEKARKLPGINGKV